MRGRVFKTLTLYSNHKTQNIARLHSKNYEGLQKKIKKIYTFEQKAMHELSEKSRLSNPAGKNTYTSPFGHSLNTAN